MADEKPLSEIYYEAEGKIKKLRDELKEIGLTDNAIVIDLLKDASKYMRHMTNGELVKEFRRSR